MARTRFASLIFKGARFEGALMPLDALPELAGYRELILSVAKALWQRRNSGRVRLPKGFEASLRLVLTGVESGSAIPVIEREVEVSNLPLMQAEVSDHFEDSRRMVELAIYEVGKGRNVPDDFPLEALGKFAAFGRGLQPDEHIIVTAPGLRDGPVYNKDVRKRILLQGQTTYEDGVTLVGQVRAADKDNEFFRLETFDGHPYRVRCSPLFLPVALRGILSDEAFVRVQGIGLFDARDQLIQVTDAQDVSPLEEGSPEPRGPKDGARTPLGEQFDTLERITDGWMDGEGKAPDKLGLTWFRELLKEAIDAFDLPVPHLYPTLDGHVRAEWPGSQFEVVLEVDLRKRLADLLAVSVASDEIGELHLDLQKPGKDLKLGKFIARHLSASDARADA